MTSQGHPYAIFQRALERRDLSTAWAEAHGLRVVSLADALALTLLVRQQWPAKYPRAAARWAGRYAAETDASINDVMLVASHLSAIDGSTDGDALGPLEVVLATLGRGRLAGVVTDLRRVPNDDRA